MSEKLTAGEKGFIQILIGLPFSLAGAFLAIYLGAWWASPVAIIPGFVIGVYVAKAWIWIDQRGAEDGAS